MSILNFGSCCIDNVYLVPHFVRPGETLLCDNYQVYPGGKGLNQSLALAYAGAQVAHAGKVGSDGLWLKELLTNANVDTSLISVDSGPSGHANIQVTPSGENSIVLFGGANRTITREDVDNVLAQVTKGDFLLLQNEISSLEYLVQRAAEMQLRIVFNAAPMTKEVAALPIESMELLIINEIEGASLTNEGEPQEIVNSLLSQYPELRVLLTLGAEGALFADKNGTSRAHALAVVTVDTTGAGDTFTGYFLAGYARGDSIEDCLASAAEAASICVTRPGAASSIPHAGELSA